MWEVASGLQRWAAFHFTGLGTLDPKLRDWDDLVPLRGREGNTSARWVRICALRDERALHQNLRWTGDLGRKK